MALINKVCTFAICKTLIAVGCTGASYFLNKSEPEKVVQELPEVKEQEVATENIEKRDPRYNDIGSGTWLDL